jgi:hypothetical protein
MIKWEAREIKYNSEKKKYIDSIGEKNAERESRKKPMVINQSTGGTSYPDIKVNFILALAAPHTADSIASTDTEGSEPIVSDNSIAYSLMVIGSKSKLRSSILYKKYYT